MEIQEALVLIRRKAQNAYNIRERLRREPVSNTTPHLVALFDQLTQDELNDYGIVAHLVWVTDTDPPSEIVPSLIRGFGSSSDMTREAFAERLAASGLPEAAKALATDVARLEGRTIGSILTGLEYITRNVAPEFCQVLSGILAPLFESKLTAEEFYNACRLWIQIDPIAATERLTRAPYWSTESDFFRMLVFHLADAEAEVLHDRLLEIEPQLEFASGVSAIHYPGAFLILAASSGLPGFEERASRFEELEKTTDRRTDLVKARVLAAGIRNPFRQLKNWRKGEEIVRSAPRHIQELLALQAFFVEVYNGGIGQYFFNSSGNLWPEAKCGFEAAGNPEALSAFQTALHTFGPNGPSIDRVTRMDQLSAIHDCSKEVYSRCSNLLIDTAAEEIMWGYVLKHADIFRVKGECNLGE